MSGITKTYYTNFIEYCFKNNMALTFFSEQTENSQVISIFLWFVPTTPCNILSRSVFLSSSLIIRNNKCTVGSTQVHIHKLSENKLKYSQNGCRGRTDGFINGPSHSTPSQSVPTVVATTCGLQLQYLQYWKNTGTSIFSVSFQLGMKILVLVTTVTHYLIKKGWNHTEGTGE